MPKRVNTVPGVYKRGNKWRARASLDGREVTRSFVTRDEAMRWKREQERAFERGEWIDPQASSIRFGEWTASWMATKSNLAPRTVKNYETRIRTLLLPTFGSMKLTAITNNEISKWVANSKEVGRGSVSIRQAYGVLKQILAAAVLDCRLTRNPATGVPLPRTTPRKKTALNQSELRQLAESAGRFSTLILLAGTTGMRWGEIAALQCKDVSMLHRTISVDKAVTDSRTGSMVASTKTHTSRVVPFPKELAKDLEELITTRSPEDRLFSMPGGGVLEYNNFMNRYFRPAVEAAGIVEISFHSLRHTAASLLISQGTPITAVSGILGHASTKMTLDVYGHFYKDDAFVYMDRLGESLYSGTAKERPDLGSTTSISHG
jgi:integrase